MSDASRESHVQLIARLNNQIDEILAPHVGQGPYAILDFPDHSNVGDSLIYLGELNWLSRQLGQLPTYSCRYDSDRDEIAKAMPSGTIFLHGGGNFGDVWPWYQKFREDVLRQFRGRSIVQLPQSIHFDDPTLADSTAKAIADHGAFTLMVRDRESYEFAIRRFDCPVYLCPDMAFALGPLDRVSAPVRDVLLLLRTDKETRLESCMENALVAEDWLDTEPGLHKRMHRAMRLRTICNLRPSAWRRSARQVLYYRLLAENRKMRGAGQLSSAKMVVSDRLHAHILSTLLGIPHVVLDNYYGKIGRFVEAFGTDWRGMMRAGSLEEGLEMARAQIGRSGIGRIKADSL